MHHLRHKVISVPKIAFVLLLVLLLVTVAAQSSLQALISFTEPLGYVGTFIAGILYAYSMTSVASIILLLLLAPTQNIFLTILVASVGAMVGDMFVFSLIRSTLKDELRWIAETKLVRYVWSFVPLHWRKWLLPLIGVLIIASPLPDEIGVALFAASTHVPARVFVPLSIILNGVGLTLIVASELALLHIFTA